MSQKRTKEERDKRIAEVRAEVARRLAGLPPDPNFVREKFREPRYDDVYWKGMEWLDSLSSK